MDMPYTGWVLQYQYYNKTTAGWWVNSTEPVTGRKRELYLCVSDRFISLEAISIEHETFCEQVPLHRAIAARVSQHFHRATSDPGAAPLLARGRAEHSGLAVLDDGPLAELPVLAARLAAPGAHGHAPRERQQAHGLRSCLNHLVRQQAVRFLGQR